MDILSLVKFTENYANALSKLGLKDKRFYIGAAALSNTFVKRILRSSSEIITEVINREKNEDP